MKLRSESLTITLHWFAGETERVSTVVCEDGAPAQLIPLLLNGCGLPLADASGRPLRYALRLGAPTGPQLRDSERASHQGLRSGGHLWLTEQGQVRALRCALTLPDGSELLVPQPGLILSRGWLLQALALLNPAAYRRELELLERRVSAYRYVSSRPHCAIQPAGHGWAVSSDRADVVTRLNERPLTPGAAAALSANDLLTLGDEGPALRVLLLGRAADEV